MRFALVRAGGVAGLARPPVVVDTGTLGAEDAARLHDLTDRAGFFGLPADLGPAEPAPDAFGYELTVTADDGREHAVSFAASAAPPALRELVEAIRRAARS